MPAKRPAKELTRWTTKREPGRDMAVTLLAIHESVGITDPWDLALFCERRGVSYHDVTDNSTMVHTVRFSDTAWHLRDGCDASTGLCLTTPTRGYSREEWLGPQRGKVEIAAWWTTRAAKIHGLPLRHCNHAQIRSALRGNKGDGGVITHNDYTLATKDGTHTDPRNFPMDVCLDMAREITDAPEDDMAQVPQAEWNRVRDLVSAMWVQFMGTDGKGWDSFRVNNKARMSFVDFARSCDRELNQKLDLTGRPMGDQDTALGHILSTRAELRIAAQKWDEYMARTR